MITVLLNRDSFVRTNHMHLGRHRKCVFSANRAIYLHEKSNALKILSIAEFYNKMCLLYKVITYLIVRINFRFLIEIQSLFFSIL